MFGRRNSFEEGFSLGQWLLAPVRWSRRQWRRLSRPDTFEERRSGWFWDALAFPFRLLLSIGVFMVSGWAGTRSQWAFFLGIPALGGLLSVMMGALAFSYLSPRNYTRYHGNGLMLLQEEDYDNALGFLRKACVLRFPKGFDGVPAAEKDWMVDVGQAVHRRENLDRAIEWIELVSPPHAVGNFQGHLWIASRLLDLPEGPSPEQLAMVEHHLQSAERLKDTYRDDPDLELRLHVAFVRYFQRTGRMAEAVDNHHLRRIAELAPGGLPEYLAVLKDLDRMEEFRVAYRDGMTRLTEWAGENPNNTVFRMSIGRAEILNGSYDEGLQAMMRGLRQMTDAQARGRMAGFVSWYLMEWHRADFAWEDERKFKLGVVNLCRALLLQPLNPDAVKAAIALLQDPRLEGQTENWLVDLVGEKQIGPLVQALIGVQVLWNDSEQGVEKARSYWSIAETLDRDRVPLILCQIAGSLDRTDPIQLQQAIELLDVAISSSPTNPRYRFVQAQILTEAQQWLRAKQLLDELIQQGHRNGDILKLGVHCAKELNDSTSIATYEAMLSELVN